jgi:hypothetical protein
MAFAGVPKATEKAMDRIFSNPHLKAQPGAKHMLVFLGNPPFFKKKL